MEFEVGIYDDLTYEEYASIPAYRSHDLTSAIKCPYSWKNAKPMQQTPALLEGRVQHTVFLEYHKFDDEFVIQPQIDRRTKAGKEAEGVQAEGTKAVEGIQSSAGERRDAAVKLIIDSLMSN